MSAPEPLAPLARVAVPGRHGAEGAQSLRISLPARDLVQVAARRGQEAALAEALGMALPGPGTSTSANGRTAIWLQPGLWVIAAERGEEGALARSLSDAAGSLGAVIDQTHGRATIRVEGAHVRDMLAKGCRLDLHPKVFPEGRVASTTIAHIGCLLHHAGPDTFELTMFATFAQSFWEWATGAAAEFGYEVA